MVLAASVRIPRVLTYSGIYSLSYSLIYGIITLFDHSSHNVLSKIRFASLYNLQPQLLGLGSFPFARRYSGNLFWFLFLQVLRCFSSLRLASLSWYHCWWVPPFGYQRLLRVRTAWRCVSPFAASFFALMCLGILHMLFFAYPRWSFLTTLNLFSTFL